MSIVVTILDAPKAEIWRRLLAAGIPDIETAFKQAPGRLPEIQEAYLAYCAEENARLAAEQAVQQVEQRRREIRAHIERQLDQGLEWAYGDDLSQFTEDRDQWQPKGTRARQAVFDEFDRKRPPGANDAPAVLLWVEEREAALTALG